ncbi:MAG: hypothetical protein ACLSX5_05195 [Lachnospiraceae bacterium]
MQQAGLKEPIYGKNYLKGLLSRKKAGFSHSGIVNMPETVQMRFSKHHLALKTKTGIIKGGPGRS